MKPFISKKITKNLIFIIVIMFIVTSILSNFTYAVSDMDEGLNILRPIEQFVVFICDEIMEWLQKTFTSTQSIDNGDGTYTFQYSPAIIFSGTVMGLDINFIEPNTDERNTNNFEAFLRAKTDEYFDDVEEVTEDEYNEQILIANQKR